MTSVKPITIYHSPDADDAFMFYGMVKGEIGYPGYEFTHDLCDIESLNHRALAGELDVTAVSVHAYSQLQDKYAILSCGASMGGSTYGPRLVALNPCNLADGKIRRLAIPGPMTSAALALRLFLKSEGIEAELISIHFDQVFAAIKDGRVDAGVIIHEGQITHGREGFVLLKDLGSWWWEKTQLPLPLGVNVARKSLGSEALTAAGTVLKQSILYSLKYRKEAIDYALSYGRGLSFKDADTFISMYVNDFTIDLGDIGQRAIRAFLAAGYKEGLITLAPAVEFVDLSSVKAYE